MPIHTIRLATNCVIPVFSYNAGIYTHMNYVLAFIAGRYLSKDELLALLKSYEVQLSNVDDGILVECEQASQVIHSCKTIVNSDFILIDTTMLGTLCTRMCRSGNLTNDEKLRCRILFSKICRRDESSEWKTEAKELLDKLVEDNRLWVFRECVDAADINYHTIISEPMSFTKLQRDFPSSAQEFGRQLKLIWQNAHRYNKKSSDAYKDATLLCSVTKKIALRYHHLFADMDMYYIRSCIDLQHSTKKRRHSEVTDYSTVDSSSLIIGESSKGTFVKARKS